VKRIRTTRSSDSAVLQDLQYWYDPVGNITLQKDLAHQPVYFNGSVADAQNNYIYDALYRLIQAQGRELAGDNSAPTYNDSSRSGIIPVPIASTDTAKIRRYTQYYGYDAVGNFVQMRHTVTGGTGNWTRYYTTNAANNRLQQTVVGSGTPENYGYDTRGNIIGGFSHLQSLTYNADNRLEKIVIDSNRMAYYQYDSSGQRVRKTVVNTSANTTDSRKYVGEWELYHKFTTSSLTTIVKRETLHVSDDTGRIALIDTRTSGTGTEPVQLLRYQYSNHLQSASLELDASGAIISYEEYYPYGSTSFQSGRSSVEVSLKRYRYTGKERDEESGLYYHGARYYVPWLARWTAVDPLESKFAGRTPYCYGGNNPIIFNDPDGQQERQTFSSNSQKNTDDAQVKYEEGEKRTQAMFKDKLTEIVGSKADSSFKNWIADIGQEGVTSFRDTLFQSKVDSWQNNDLQKRWYGTDPNDSSKAYLPEELRKKFWNDAIAETIPTLKASWSALMTGETSGILFTHYKNLTISNREEGWAAIKSAGISVGIQWALHLCLGGFSNLMKSAQTFAEQSAAFQLANLERSIPGAHFLSRHGAQTTLAQQLERATTGLTPDGLLRKPIDASRFLSHQLELKAVKQAEFIHKTTGATSFRFDMGKAVGEGYIKGGNSVIETSTVQAVFRNGKLYTMYPKLR